MKTILPANRVAALATWATGLGAFITAVEGTLPVSWQNYALAAAGLLTQAVTTLHFLSGSQKYDALQAHAAVATRTQPGVPAGELLYGLALDPEGEQPDIEEPAA